MLRVLTSFLAAASVLSADARILAFRRFLVGPWSLRFVRAPDGKVRGVELHRARLLPGKN
jgi:hypothetical protein